MTSGSLIGGTEPQSPGARAGSEETGQVGFWRPGGVQQSILHPATLDGWRVGPWHAGDSPSERVLGIQVVVDAMGWMRSLREGVQGEKRDDLG